MQITSLLIGLIILGLCVFFVNRPFQEREEKPSPGSQTRSQPGLRRQSMMSALRDLDFDYRTGKVSEDDYSLLRARLLSEVACLIQEEQQADEKLEALIRERRGSKLAAAGCSECGASIAAGQRFCANCGSPVGIGSCPACGSHVKSGDIFCSSCGSRIAMQLETAG